MFWFVKETPNDFPTVNYYNTDHVFSAEILAEPVSGGKVRIQPTEPGGRQLDRLWTDFYRVLTEFPYERNNTVQEEGVCILSASLVAAPNIGAG